MKLNPSRDSFLPMINGLGHDQSEKKVGNFVLQTKIGQGAFGNLYRGRSMINNNTYAIKEI